MTHLNKPEIEYVEYQVIVNEQKLLEITRGRKGGVVCVSKRTPIGSYITTDLESRNIRIFYCENDFVIKLSKSMQVLNRRLHD